MSRVVVGIDGSEVSMAALRWALHEAELRKVPVELLYAWMVPASVTASGLAVSQTDSAFEKAAQQVLDHAEETAKEVAPDVKLEKVVVYGQAAQELVRAAVGAELLVVGSRGHGGFTGLLLGSVSAQVAHHAPCPLVIVHAGQA